MMLAAGLRHPRFAKPAGSIARADPGAIHKRHSAVLYRLRDALAAERRTDTESSLTIKGRGAAHTNVVVFQVGSMYHERVCTLLRTARHLVPILNELGACAHEMFVILAVQVRYAP